MKDKLKRNINLILLTFFGIGNILGAGIYVITGEIGRIAGIYAPLAFLVASTVALLSAFSYSEMSARLPYSAGEAVYVQTAFHHKSLSIIVGFAIAIAGMVSAAVITRGFAEYFLQFVDISESMAIIGLLFLLCLLTLWGIKEAAMASAVITIIEISGLLLLLYAGSDLIFEFSDRIDRIFKLESFSNLKSIFAASFIAFYAYIGFEDMVNIAEEVKNPKKNMPKGIFLSLFFTFILYFLVSYVYVFTIADIESKNVEAPLSFAYERLTGSKAHTMSLIASFAVINGALFQMIMASRIFYGMSKKKLFPAVFSKTLSKSQTPLYSTIMVAFIIMVLALFLPTIGLAKATSFIILSVFSMVHLSLIKIKKTNPAPKGVHTYPAFIPYLGLLVCLLFLVFEIIF
ncbi:MAG: amino acid permease [Spirochaetia bacterium]|nr:amino acid permease [Spirochaetia bacterium]